MMNRKNNGSLSFHELLQDIVEQFGEDVLTENRLRGLVSDFAVGGDIMKFQIVINRSISCHIGEKLLKLRDLDEADFTLHLSTLKQTFQEENFFRYGVSDYIIDSYLFALGWIEKVDGYQENENVQFGARLGELSFVEWNDEEYCGSFSKENERSGFGICKREDGNYYAGEWKFDMKNGMGMDVAFEREKYAGEWRLNRKNGIGISVQANGVHYSGEWKNGKIHGVGILFFPNGERLCARFENGQLKEGTGSYFLQDGTYIVGPMDANGPNGQCLHFGLDGSYKTEEWIYGIKKQE